MSVRLLSAHALVGKYLNSYEWEDGHHVPSGWDEWHAFLGRAPYYDYDLSENGTPVHYGLEEEDYQTDVLTRKARDAVRRSAGDGRPLFLYLAPGAPHERHTAAERHEGLFEDARAPRPPYFDEPDVTDKPDWVRNLPRLSAEEEAALDQVQRERLEMLQALDELVVGVVEELSAAGEVDNTCLFVASDNGYHLGEHRIADGKGTAYEESIRVPLAVRGPGIPAGRKTKQMALNIDLAPTFAKLAAASIPAFVDGRSLKPTFAQDAASWRTAFLEEFRAGQKVPPHVSVRTSEGKKLVQYASGAEELYDLKADPHELENLLRTGEADPTLVAELHDRLRMLKRCAGISCREAEGGRTAIG